MKTTTIARNYAEALFRAGEAHDAATVERYGALLDDVAGAIGADPRIAIALDSPRVAKATKANLLAEALRGVAPGEFVRFLQAVVYRGRQGLLANAGKLGRKAPQARPVQPEPRDQRATRARHLRSGSSPAQTTCPAQTMSS